LAWAQLASGQEEACRTTCHRLFAKYADTEDVEAIYRLTADLGLGLQPGFSLLRGLGRPAADHFLQAIQRRRDDAIVYTACLLPDHGLPAEDLVDRARANVQAQRSAAYYETLGAALYRAGQDAEAIVALDGAVKLHGKGGTTWTKLFLALAHARQHRPDQARAWLEKAQLGENAGWEERLIHTRLRAEVARLLPTK
jgi:hypothetical protein